MPLTEEEETFLRSVYRDAHRRGLKLFPQHRRILAILLFRKLRRKGPISYDALAFAIDSKTNNPSRCMQVRIRGVRRALEPFGFEIATVRNIGYELYEEELGKTRAA